MAGIPKNYQQISRLFSTARLLRAVESKAASAGEHGDYTLWKKLFFLACVPAISLCMVNTYMDHQAHHHDERPAFVAYDYLRVRTKKFPWGDGNHSLFHNPHVNPLPDGYET